MGQSMFFIGSVIGSLLFGILADKYGRLHILVVSNLMALVGNGLTVFTTNVVAFSVFRLLAGMATDSNFVMMYILGKATNVAVSLYFINSPSFLVMEYIRPSMRTFGLNLCIGLFYCIGSIVTPWIAVAVGNWKWFLVATSAPIVVVPFFYCFVQESVMWLISRNEIDAAINCFRRVAKVNGKVVAEETYEKFRAHCKAANVDNRKESATLLDLFRTPRLRKSTLILFFKSYV